MNWAVVFLCLLVQVAWGERPGTGRVALGAGTEGGDGDGEGEGEGELRAFLVRRLANIEAKMAARTRPVIPDAPGPAPSLRDFIATLACHTQTVPSSSSPLPPLPLP